MEKTNKITMKISWKENYPRGLILENFKENFSNSQIDYFIENVVEEENTLLLTISSKFNVITSFFKNDNMLELHGKENIEALTGLLVDKLMKRAKNGDEKLDMLFFPCRKINGVMVMRDENFITKIRVKVNDWLSSPSEHFSFEESPYVENVLNEILWELKNSTRDNILSFFIKNGRYPVFEEILENEEIIASLEDFSRELNLEISVVSFDKKTSYVDLIKIKSGDFIIKNQFDMDDDSDFLESNNSEKWVAEKFSYVLQ
jgi:hypothetical protein